MRPETMMGPASACPTRSRRSSGAIAAAIARFATRAALAAAASRVVLVPARARATPSARLVYSRAPGAESCADEQALRAAVAKRVGYDPLFPWAKQTVVASMARAGDRGFAARVFLVDERGIDPQSLAGPPAAQPAPTPEPSETIPPTPDLEPGPPPSPPPPARGVAPSRSSDSTGSRVRLSATAGMVGSVGVAPAPAVGAALGVVVRWRAASLNLEGRFDPAASAPAPGGGRVSSSLVLLTLAPCGHAGLVFGCALVQAGQVRATGEGSTGADQAAAWWAAGARVGVAIPLGGGLSLRVHSDMLVNLAPQTFEYNQTAAWKAPALAGSLGVAAVWDFF